jgi:hypothetical protein
MQPGLEKFAEENQIRIRPDTLDVNYLEICDSAENFAVGEPSAIAKGIRDVTAGLSDEFAMEYPCHGEICEKAEPAQPRTPICAPFSPA